MTNRVYTPTIIVLFTLGWALIYINRTALYPLLIVIQEEFSLSAAQAGMITSAYYLFYVLFQIPAGMLGDRFGLKRVLVASFALHALSMLVVAKLTSSYTALLLSTTLYGGSAAAFHPMAFSLGMRSVPFRLRGVATATINTGSAFGLVFGLSAGGLIYLATGNWRSVFLLLAAPTLMLAVLFAAVVRPVENVGAPDIRSIGRLLGNKNLFFIYLASFCSLYAFTTVVVWGPTFFQTERGISPALAGVYTALIAIGGVPAGLFFARLSDRWGRKGLAHRLMLLAALTLTGMALARSLQVVIVLLILFGVTGKLAWEPISVAWTGDHATSSHPKMMGSALALFGTIGVASSIVAPLVAGWVRDLTGSLQGAFLLAAFVLLLGSLCVRVPRETVYRATTSQQAG